jgi:chromosome segregation ATPase
MALEDDVTVAPESEQGRERITRLEERVQSNTRQIHTFGPLPMQVERIQWGLDELKQDIKDRDSKVDARFDRHEQVIDAKLEDLARSFAGQISTCSDRIAKISDHLEAEAKTKREEKSSDKTSRRAMWGLIGAAAVTGFLGLVTQVVTALSG